MGLFSSVKKTVKKVFKEIIHDPLDAIGNAIGISPDKPAAPPIEQILPTLLNQPAAAVNPVLAASPTPPPSPMAPPPPPSPETPKPDLKEQLPDTKAIEKAVIKEVERRKVRGRQSTRSGAGISGVLRQAKEAVSGTGYGGPTLLG